MTEAEQLEEMEFRDTKAPFLRVATGGKGPPEGPVGPIDNWLEKLPVGTVFACRANENTVDWEMYFIAHKYTRIYLLKMETPDGKVWERRVHPKLFCKHYRDYEEVAYYPQHQLEAPKGDANGDREQRNQGGHPDVVRNAADGGNHPLPEEEE